MAETRKLSEQEIENLKRWRLILGSDSEDTFNSMSAGNAGLTGEYDMMDMALNSIYGGGLGNDFGQGRKGAGNGASSPVISKWLGDIRSLFDKDTVTIIQNDAIERKGLKQLIFEPEILEKLEPDINLATTLLTLKDQIPKRSKENVRAFIAKIVEEINKLLENDIRQAIVSALNKKQHSPIPNVSAIDYKTTIRRNLKHYSSELGMIVPERFWFFDHASKTNSRHVIIDIDQSGSMGQSVIYSSIMACILASMNSIKTHIVAFDTQIVDLTEKTDDPVDLLYGFQLGGGTDINKSIKYCRQFIEEPSKTIFFLVSDLDEGGNRNALYRNIEEMKEDGVTVICLLAIADGGKPYYDAVSAKHIAGMGVPVFACPPERLPELLANAFSGHSLEGFENSNKKQ